MQAKLWGLPADSLENAVMGWAKESMTGLVVNHLPFKLC